MALLPLFFACLLTIFAALLLWASAAQAQTIYVDASVTTGANDGTSWSNAYTDLQDTLAAATGNDQIWIAEGTYFPDEGASVTADDEGASFTITGDQDGLKIYGGFAGTESALSGRTGGHPTILSGDIAQDDGPFAPNTDSDGKPSTFSDTDHINGTNSYHVLLFDGGDGIGSGIDANITGATVLDGVTVTGGR